jgi:large subunit ribosomal protein L22
MSPRKVRLVAGLVRGLDVARAEAQLGLLNKAAALPVLKLLRSAIANAEHNNKLEKEGLFIKSITVDGGPMLKRWRPRAFGRAAPIRKRTSHITIILADQTSDDKKQPTGLKAAVVKKDEKKSGQPAKDKGKAKAEEKPEEEKKGAAKKPAVKKEDKKGGEKKAEKKGAAKKPAAKAKQEDKPAADKADKDKKDKKSKE